jgi:DNA-binding CsgD family transcriptional regulator/PAS domain-containing protein
MGEHKHAEQPLAKTFNRRSWQSTDMTNKHSGIPLQSTLNVLERLHKSSVSQATITVQSEELRSAHQELRKKEAEAAFGASEAKYRLLFDETVTGVALLEIVQSPSQNRISDARILEVNTAFVRCTGIPCHRLVGNSIRGLWPKTQDSWFDLFDRVLNGDQNVQAEGSHRESGKYMLVGAFRLDMRRIGVTLIDISAQKKVEEALERSRNNLEKKVKEHTAEIQRVNLQLRKEVEARKIMEEALREKSRQLEIRTERLEEANTTLKVLLRERDSERRELEERVASNINELIRPHLSKLCAANLGERRQALVDAIGRGLEDITSPLSRRFIMECSHLTPMETQVAGLIRQGRTTKEISDLMGVASSTVDYHRFNIRRKLDLTNKRMNLQSYLKSLS